MLLKFSEKSTYLARQQRQCLRCAKARCPDCLKTARYVKKGKWMVCSDHEWTPQDLAMFEEQQRIKKSGADKGKRKVRGGVVCVVVGRESVVGVGR